MPTLDTLFSLWVREVQEAWGKSARTSHAITSAHSPPAEASQAPAVRAAATVSHPQEARRRPERRDSEGYLHHTIQVMAVIVIHSVWHREGSTSKNTPRPAREATERTCPPVDLRAQPGQEKDPHALP